MSPLIFSFNIELYVLLFFVFLLLNYSVSWWGGKSGRYKYIYENIRHDSEKHKEKKSFESIFVVVVLLLATYVTT